MCALRSSASRSFNASILVVIGVPNGRRFSGGSFNGCKPLRPSTVEVWVRDSGVFVARSATYSALPSPAAPTRLWVSESGLRPMLRVPISNGRLDFLGAGKACPSSSPLGDSYALGIAGTGGTSSSVFELAGCSVRGLGVGNRDEEKFWERRGCSELLEFRTGLWPEL